MNNFQEKPEKKKKDDNEEIKSGVSEEFYRSSISVILEDVFLGQAKKRQQKSLRKLRRSEKVITTIVDVEELKRGFFERTWNRFHISVHSMTKTVLGVFREDVTIALQEGPIHFSQDYGFSGAGYRALSQQIRKVLEEWYKEYRRELEQYHRLVKQKEMNEYESLSAGVLGGWLVGLSVGKFFDVFIKGLSPILEGVIRFLAGAGDTLGGALTTFRGRITGKQPKKESGPSSAKDFIVGSMIGTFLGPIMQGATLLLGINVSGIGGAFYAAAYSNGDNWTGAFFAMRSYIKKDGFKTGIKRFFSHPFQLANFLAVVFILIFNISLRATGIWSPDSYLDYAIEGAIMNNDSSIAALSVWFYAHRIKRGIRQTALSLSRVRKSLSDLVNK